MKITAVTCFLVLVATAANAEDLTVADPPSIPVEKIELSPPLVFPIRPIIEPVPDVVLIEAAAASARKIISGSINEALQLSRCPAYACTKEYNPVCGFSLCKGVRTFSNPCMLRAYNRCNYPGYAVLFKGNCELLIRCNPRTIYNLLEPVNDDISPAA